MWQIQKKRNAELETHVDGNRMQNCKLHLFTEKEVLSHFLTTFFTWSHSPEVLMEHFIAISPEKFCKFHILGGNRKAQALDTVDGDIRFYFLYLVLFGIRATETGLSCVSVSEEGHSILLIKTCPEWEKGFWHCLLGEAGLPHFLHYKMVKYKCKAA